jgi:hypothetical protein
VPVQLGLRSSTQSEIRAGLAVGDVVLAVDAEPGARVRVKRQAASVGAGGEKPLDPSTLPMPGGS